ncbi:MAG TPA: NUDIX domain-containing protein [Candidatus Paceibacterota bacterium]
MTTTAPAAASVPKIDVGIGVMVFKNGKVLMSVRKSKLGTGELAFPGGKLEYMESYEDCCRRECREEAGIEITNIKFLYTSNIRRYAPKHFSHITMIADWLSGEPQVLEPEKSETWNWYDPNDLPNVPMFETCKMAFEAYKTGNVYFTEKL